MTKKRNYIRGRNKSERVKSAKGRKKSSTRWLQRQLNDPFVQEAQERGYASRAVFKLMEIDDRFNIFKRGDVVIDLGAAPGGWSQLAAERIGAAEDIDNPNGARVVAIDLLEMDPIQGVTTLQGDFMLKEIRDKVRAHLPKDSDGKTKQVKTVMSDMAANTTGHKKTDHLRIVALAEMALDFALDLLAPGGYFVVKLFQGGGEPEFHETLKKHFKVVKHLKPEASRNESSELYLFCSGFKPFDRKSS